MGDITTQNVPKTLFSWLYNSLLKASSRKIPKDKAQQKVIEDKRTKLKNLVKVAIGVSGPYIGELNKAGNYGDIIDCLFRNDLIMDLDLEQTTNYLDKLCKDLPVLIEKLSKNQSGGHEMEDINIQLGIVRRCLFFLSYFPEHFVFNLKRIIRLSFLNEVIPDFPEVDDRSWDIIDGVRNHFFLKANWREHILEYHECHYLSSKPSFEGIKGEQNVFITGTDTKLPDFEQIKLEILRFLSLRKVNLTEGIEIFFENLSFLKYLDLKHTKLEGCSWLKCLTKLQMLDLRYTNVKEIDGDDLEKLENLQHLLLGNAKEEGKYQLEGAKLSVKKSTATKLKTLRAIEQPDIEEISNVGNVVDLFVTGLTTEHLQKLWATLENFENLSSLGVAVTHKSDINLKDCGPKLKNNLKRLRVEGFHSGLGKAFKKLGIFFGNLIDLTLASHVNIDINKISGLQKLLCLRLYGICQNEEFQIRLQGFDKLTKLVLGDMTMVKKVEISCAVIETVATLKLSNLPLLKEVVYLDKQHSNKHYSLLGWENIEVRKCPKEVPLQKTIFLRRLEVPVYRIPSLMIYHYDMNQQCYKYIKHSP